MRYYKFTDPTYSWLTRLSLALGQWESPIEALFWQEARQWVIFPFIRQLPGLRRQVRVGQYRLDFAIISCRFCRRSVKLAIEIDGWLYHSTNWQKEQDRQRQLYCEARGWQFIRFTGSEVYRNPGECVDKVKRLL